MKILSVVTLVTPDGEYGGPLRVAVNQLQALAARGHEVVLTGATRGFASAPEHIDGVRARLFPARTLVPRTGFAGIAAPGLWRAMHQHATEFDVVHVHAARDLVTLPAARIAQFHGVPTVLQTHGMIDETDNPLAIPLDAALTRPALRSAQTVTYLTPTERDSLTAVSGDRARLAELRNGVPSASDSVGDSAVPDVLFLARLAPRKNPVTFVQAASRLAGEFPTARFSIVGPDEGEGARVRRAIDESGYSNRIAWEGALSPEETGARMKRATIYVLPAVDEPYPMAVLEAMAAGLPVIVTDSCGLAPVVQRANAGLVVAPGTEELIEALRALLTDPAEARRRGDRGREVTRREFTMDAIAARLESLYQVG